MRFSSRLGRWIVGAVGLVVAGAASAQAPREVTIGVSSSSLGAAGYRLANELGLWQKQGLTPKFVIMDSGNAVITALISGSVQIVQAGMGELVAAQARGQDVVATTNTYGGTSATLVLAKSVADKLGVSPNAPATERLKALDGLLIASTTATSSTTISYQAAAKRAGANFRSVFMAQNAMAAALESGAIQGFASGTPYWSFPVTRGTGVIWLSGPKGELPKDLSTASANQVQVMRSFADANPDLLKKIDAVYQDFIKMLDERPNDVKAAIAKLFPDLDGPTTDLLFEGEAYGWKAKPMTPADVAKEVGFMKMSGTQLPGLDTVDPEKALWKWK